MEIRSRLEEQIESQEVHRALSKLIAKQPRIIVIIDQKTSETEEALENLNPTPSIIEFKTYARRDAPNVRAHLFEPLYAAEKAPGKVEGKRPVPEHYRTWEKKLEWVET